MLRDKLRIRRDEKKLKNTNSSSLNPVSEICIPEMLGAVVIGRVFPHLLTSMTLSCQNASIVIKKY